MEELTEIYYKAIVFDRVNIYYKDGSLSSTFHDGPAYDILASFQGKRAVMENPRDKEHPYAPCTLYHLPYQGKYSRHNEYMLAVFDEPIRQINPFQYFKYIFRDEAKKKLVNGAVLEVYEEAPSFRNYESYLADTSSRFCASDSRRHPLTVDEQINITNDFLKENPDFFPKVVVVEPKDDNK